MGAGALIAVPPTVLREPLHGFEPLLLFRDSALAISGLGASTWLAAATSNRRIGSPTGAGWRPFLEIVDRREWKRAGW